ncbi:MFS family permease [Clavibacter michiganensis]|uniref:MFS transporter n=1 Tax=Clavibacter michiganensis TaxID=28447 RepID=UPI001959EA76|nr:MFS transporter [Clavibacter michiganensis]MBM7412874.1 MFS family permease [Clavibacter michiganensis]
MNHPGSRPLIAGSALSQLGNWVNVTAVMILLQQDHGAAAVALYFLIRTVPPVLLARPIVTLVPVRLVGRFWAGSQVTLAVTMAGLAFVADDVVALLVLLGFAGVLQSVASSWLMQIAETVAGEDRRSVITAVSTGTSVAVVAGPSLGGALAFLGGLFPVFMFDAATFVAAILLVPWARATGLRASGTPATGYRSALRGVVRSLSPLHPAGSPGLRSLALFWILFGLFGGVLTVTETPVLSDMKAFDANEIGLTISAYGLGGLLVFIASTFFGFSTDRLACASVLVVGLALWAVFDDGVVYAAFFIIGLGYSLVNSAVRVSFGDLFATSSTPVSESWAWVNQLSLLTSVVSYLTGLIYFSLTSQPAPMLVLVVALSVVCAGCGVVWDNRARALSSLSDS